MVKQVFTKGVMGMKDKNKIEKLTRIRWKTFNLFGWLFGAAAMTLYMSIGKKVPGWLLTSLGIVILLLVIQSLYIVYCKKVISNK
ncbi:hypothetical protein [Paraclostridium bifermentans]|uniref:hypothetical protein n=2 Tax=Paraclostridium bifermentans TaxID=1490 RepID=UPI001C7E92A8|nr:hypothetical protein [Paraclostridium bifermentans]